MQKLKIGLVARKTRMITKESKLKSNLRKMSKSEWSDGAPTGLKQKLKHLTTKASQIISKTDSIQKGKGICLSIESDQSEKKECDDDDDDDDGDDVKRNETLSAFALDSPSRDPNPPKEPMISVLDVLQVLPSSFKESMKLRQMLRIVTMTTLISPMCPSQ